MAFPVVAATAGGNINFNGTTSHVLNLPSGIVAGNLLIMILDVAPGPVNPFTWPGGWTELVNVRNTISQTNRLEIRFRRADGTEGSTITVTTNPGGASAHTSYRITGHDPVTSPVAASFAHTSNTNNPNPPSLGPVSWGVIDTLWLAATGCRNATNVSAFPTNYTNGIFNAHLDGLVGSARRNLAADTDDPGTFTVNSGTGVIAATIAIPPPLPLQIDNIILLAFRTTLLADNAVLLQYRLLENYDKTISILWDVCRLFENALLGEFRLSEVSLGGRAHCMIRAQEIIPLLYRIRTTLDAVIPIQWKFDEALKFDLAIAILWRILVEADEKIPLQFSLFSDWVKQAASQSDAFAAQAASAADAWTKQGASQAPTWTPE